MRVVLDTNVVASAILWGGTPRQLLQAAREKRVDGYAQLAALVRPVAIARVAPDPDDDAVIGTAIAAKAELIVTGDKPLLPVAEHQGVRIVGVSEAAQALAP